MNNRTLYLMLIALVVGIISAVATHRLLYANTLELLVPVRDLAPRAKLDDEALFTKRRIAKEQVTRENPVTEHGQIRDRRAKAVILRKDQPIYLDDTQEMGGAVKAEPREEGPKSLRLPQGTIGLVLPTQGTVSPQARVGELFDLVLFSAGNGEGNGDVQRKPLLVKVTAVAIHRKPAEGEGEGEVDSMTFALRPADAIRILSSMRQGRVLPLPHQPVEDPIPPEGPER